MLISNPYQEPSVSILILDFKREKEFFLLIKSLEKNLKINAKIIYLSNSPECQYAFQYSDYIDQMMINRENLGCGVGTRQLFHAAMSEYCIYCQVDQILGREINEEILNILIEKIKEGFFYVDLAGNQGHGQFSERAFFIRTKDYLNIPNIDTIIGSPGPWANYPWGEKHVQNYMQENRLVYASTAPAFFLDNGKISRRTYPDGSETVHYTDTKQLFIVKPFKQKYLDFPNLKLNDKEWEEVLNGKWIDGTIPEADKPYSFKYW